MELLLRGGLVGAGVAFGGCSSPELVVPRGEGMSREGQSWVGDKGGREDGLDGRV
jgi:hypothetical protein